MNKYHRLRRLFARVRTRRGLAWLLLAAFLLTLAAPGGAQSLSARLNQLLRGKQRAYARIREIKKTQATATERLWAAQAALEQVESRLLTARGQLAATRAELARARAELERLEKRRAQHERDVQAHLLALYKSGSSSYLDVVMQSASFSDFANRERYVTAIVNQDEYMLNRLVELQDRCERQRAALEEKERQRIALVNEIREDEAAARQHQAEVKAILAEANSKRAAAEEMLAEMEQEENQIRALIRAHSRGGGGYSYSGTWSGSLLRPCPGPITSPFGMRVHPITGRYKLHTGVDIGAPYGTSVRAADKGVVISTGWMKAYGQTVVIDHGSGVHTWYCHLSAITVSEGSVVSRGQVIGRVGSTGMSTGPHLHFSVLKNGDFVNPLGF
jgi:murein DD-endopeptidase MepM/ murein hydrolase activator NlpD